MIDALLPILIVAPILAAVVVFLVGLRWDQAGWPVAAVVGVFDLGVASLLVVEVSHHGRFVHNLAGFPRQYGIELVGDALAASLALLVAGIGIGTLVFARRAGPRGSSFYAGFLLLVGGLNGVILTGDLFNLFVFLEIVGLATYALVAADRSPEAALASLKYLFLGTIGASVYLVGVGYVFVATGTLNMIELEATLAEAGYTTTVVRAAYVFIFVGLALKIAQFPLHTWQPDAYQRAPDAVTIFIAALVSTAAAYALLRVTFTAFTGEFLAANPMLADGIALMAAISIVAGSALAAVQTDLKRLFAYSSVAQFGMVVATVAVATDTALQGGVIHLLGHGLVKGGLFLAVGMLALGFGARTIDDLAGLASNAPWTSAGLTLLGMVLIGVPPSVGFVGKWYIAVGAVEADAWGIAAVILISTLLTLAYVARIAERLYFGSPAGVGADVVAADGGEPDGSPRPQRVTDGMRVLLALAVIVSVGLGFAGVAFGSFFETVIRGFLA